MAAAYCAIALAAAWTVAFILPVEPFEGLLPILIGGGPGTWLLMGYLLYVSVGVAGFSAFSSLLTTLELQEGKTPDSRLMGAGLVLLFVGVTSSCLLLGFAGGLGGYSQSHVTGTSLTATLDPFLDVTRLTAAAAVAGAFFSVVGILRAKTERLAE